MLPKQVVRYEQLIKEGLKSEEITNLFASLKLFPTPYKGIYYVPGVAERKARFIEKPLLILSRATELYLHSKKFYFSCITAEEYYGIHWQPTGKIHIVNEKISRQIDLDKRIEQNKNRKTYRGSQIAKLLSSYGLKIIFHRTKSIKDCKFKQTPYGRYAYKSQIKIDKKRFRCEK
jgi:hypothetical protein